MQLQIRYRDNKLGLATILQCTVQDSPAEIRVLRKVIW